MLKRYQISEGRFCDGTAESCPIQVYVNPDDAEKRFLVNELKLDEHTLASSLDPDELARLEFEPEHVAVIVKRPRSYSAEDLYLFRVSSMGLFLFKDKLVIISGEDVQPLEGRQFQRISSLPDLLLRILFRTTLHYLEHLRIINQISDELETKVRTAMENRHLINLFTLEKGMTYYHNAIHSNGVVIDKLKSSATKIGFTPENLEYLDDLAVENSQCYKQAEIFSNIFASLMDARASIVSNNLNVLMKTLNLITIAIMVPTLVVSIFSMNVRIPFAEHTVGFWIIVGMAAISSVAFAIIWRLVSAARTTAEPYPRRRQRRRRKIQR
jgi:magnesium transporter